VEVLPAGIISEVYKGSFNADLYYTFAEVNKALTHSESSKLSYTLDIPRPLGVVAEHAVLELLVESRERLIDWKIRVNGVSVSKEFKPVVSVKVGEIYLHKLIYDVKSVLNTPESMNKARVHMTVRHEGGGSIILRAVGFIVAYSHFDAYTSMKYYTGLLLVGEGERYSLSDVCVDRDSLVDLVAFSPAPVPIVLSNGFNQRRILVKGLANIQLDNSYCGYLEINHEGSDSGGGNPFLVLGVLSKKFSVRKPSLKLASITPMVSGNEVNISLRITNEGDAIPDEAMLVVLDKGFVRGVKKIKPPSPGEVVEESIKIPLNLMPEGVTLRLVWKKLARTQFEDTSVKLAQV
jgi:hypothetical protein